MQEILKNMKFDSVSYALSNITNLIAQEIYKLAVIRLHLPDYTAICKLYEYIKTELAPIIEHFNEAEIYSELVERLVTAIVLGTNHDNILEVMNDFLDDKFDINLEHHED